MNREARGSTRKTGYRAGGVAVLAGALCLANAAHAQLRGAESGWAGRPAPGSTDAANDGRYRIRLAPPKPGETDGDGPILKGDAFRAPTSSPATGLRRDGGDARTGILLDLGGGPGFADRSPGANMDMRARGLATRDDGDRQWGLSWALRMAPDARGRGLSLSFLPSWTDDADEAKRPWWPEGAWLPARESDDTWLEAEVGYGLDAFDGRGVLTPYIGVSEAVGGREIQAGVRLSFAAMSGATERAASSEPDRHSVGVPMRLPLGAHRAGTAPAPRTPRDTTAAREAPAPEPPANAVRAADRTFPAVPPAAPRAADGPRYRVQLGAFSGPAAAGRARTTLAGALEDVLAGRGRGLIVDASGSDGLFRVVLSDSFAGRRAAAAVCAGIAARGRDCYVARVR